METNTIDNVICFQEYRIERIVRREVHGMGAAWAAGKAIKSALDHYRVQKQAKARKPDMWKAIRHGLNVAKHLHIHGLPPVPPSA